MRINVHGPMGSGKTHNAKALARHFGVKRIIDGATEEDTFPDNCLVLSIHPLRGMKCIPIREALAQIGKEPLR